MATSIILGVLFIYIGFVVYKKYKNAKEGKFCNCGCNDCPSKKICHNEKNRHDSR